MQFLISDLGRFAYSGPANQLLDTLDSQGVPCPPYTSPADFILQIASGDQGPDSLRNMVNHSQNALPLISQFSRQTRPLDELTRALSYPNWIHFKYLLYRCWLLNIRDPMLTSMRLLSHIAMAFFIGWLFGSDVGSYSNCPPRLGSKLILSDQFNIQLNVDGKCKLKYTFSLGKTFNPMRFQTLSNETMEEIKGSMDNLSSIFFGQMIILFGAMLPTLVTFPLEM